MSDYTPEEIEAAAKAIHDTVEAQYVKAGMRLTWGSKQQDPTTRECYREQARAALAAADNDARERGIARVDTQTTVDIDAIAGRYDAAFRDRDRQSAAAWGSARDVPGLVAEVARLEADLTVAVHEAMDARAKLAGHYCGGRDKA